MLVRRAVDLDVPHISRLETNPEYRNFVGVGTEAEHLAALADHDTAYLIAEEPEGAVSNSIAGFSILRGLQSPHHSIELKRIVVPTPNQGQGRRLLRATADYAFRTLRAHRLWLDVFVTNTRARHVYESFGFQPEGVLRDAIYRDGQYHSLVLMSLLMPEYQPETKGPEEIKP